MKSKTINKVIKKKINDWLSSINDDALISKLRRDIIVTGGCITSMLLNEKVNDFDIYFRTKETTKMVAEYYAKIFNNNNKDRNNKLGKPLHAWVLDGEDVELWKQNKKNLNEFAFDYPDFKYANTEEWASSKVSGMIVNTTQDRIKLMINSDGVAEDSDSIADDAEYDIPKYLSETNQLDILEDIPATKMEEGVDKYKPIFLSTNAITLSNKVQLVIRFYGDPSEIHKNYDFVHTTNYWTFYDGVVLNQRALEAILNKELFYVGSKYPIASLIRTRKFIRRGWHINAGQYVKMSFQISDLDLTDIYVLEDQLVGVDSIYFLSFISSMREKMAKDKDFVMTRGYVTTVIDKIFG